MKYLSIIFLAIGLTACGSVPHNTDIADNGQSYEKCGVVYQDKEGVEFKKTECKPNWPENFAG